MSKKKHTITVIEDVNGDGGQVLLDGTSIQSGPDHDFYPQCWGITEYGIKWRGIHGLAMAIALHYGTENVTMVYKKGEWDYNGVIHEITD